MKRFVQVALLVLSGAGLLQTSLFTEEYLRYVKAGMRPLLVVSGVVLVVLGVLEAWTATTSRRPADNHDGHEADNHDGHEADRHDGHEADRHDGHEEESGHGHSGVPRVAWLLFLPVLSLLFYAPPALGAYTASREPAKVVATVDDDGFDPLPKTSPLPITLTDFTQRVQQDRSLAVKGRPVRLTGFVSPAGGGGGDGWYLTRIVVSCCAADATTLKVRVYGTAAPKADTWLSVTGVWHPGGRLGTSSAAVALDARSLKTIPKPSNSYMDALPLG